MYFKVRLLPSGNPFSIDLDFKMTKLSCEFGVSTPTFKSVLKRLRAAEYKFFCWPFPMERHQTLFCLSESCNFHSMKKVAQAQVQSSPAVDAYQQGTDGHQEATKKPLCIVRHEQSTSPSIHPFSTSCYLTA